uniref:Ima1_N domain-containing protein n=1 Tax=Steinernema glaseri TaxID=37863 RepID=A0A1I8AUL8_9BILA
MHPLTEQDGTVYSVILVVVAACYFLYTIIRPRFKYRTQCWFCSQYTSVEHRFLNCFTCPHCEQYNGFKSNGDYNRRIGGPTELSSRQFCRRVPKDSIKSNNGLCKKCNDNQVLLISQINRFEPSDEMNFSAELQEYKDTLDRMYPLCDKCTTYTNKKLVNDQCKWAGTARDSRSFSGFAFKDHFNRFLTPTIDTDLDSSSASSERCEKLDERTQKFFFNSGMRANLCFLSAYVIAVLFLSSNFDELQMDSDHIIFDLHFVYPSLILNLLPTLSSNTPWISMAALGAHGYGMYSSKAHAILPDLLGVGAWIFMIGAHFVPYGLSDPYFVRFIAAITVCLTSASVAFLPRRRKHLQKLNRSASSVFPNSLNPLMERSPSNSDFVLSSSFRRHRVPTMDCEPEYPEPALPIDDHQLSEDRDRGITPTREIRGILGGLTLDNDSVASRVLRNRRPLSSPFNYSPARKVKTTSRLGAVL